MATGDSGREAYTAIAWGVGLSLERSISQGPRVFDSLEGNMCGTVMRGADTLPGSKATSRAKGSYRNLGGLVAGRRNVVWRAEYGGPPREDDELKPTMHGPGEQSEGSSARRRLRGAVVAESVERRAGAKGNMHQQSTYWTQNQFACHRRRSVYGNLCRQTAEVGAYAGKPHVRFWAAGVR